MGDDLDYDDLFENDIARSDQDKDDLGQIDVFDWNASEALDALNEVCHALHKGPDGVSKTWSEVHLFVSSVVKEACE